jgi:CubicO group peptidase (beta-lactamase class C family)
VDVDGESAPYQKGLSWATIRRACLQTPLQSPPGQVVRYSNLDMGLIAIATERLTGLDYPQALHDLVLEPLGIEAWLGDEPPRPVAAVGGSLGRHRGTELEPFNSAFWRTLGFPWGSLITTMEGALRLVLGFRATGFLPAPLATEALSDQTSPLSGGFEGWLEWSPCPWGIGAEVMGNKSPHYAATRASARSYGHVGATGALAWCDPDADLAWAFFVPRTWERWWRDMSRLGDALLLQVA